MPTKKPGSPDEKQIENLLLQYLDYSGYYPIKIDNTGIFDPKRGVFRSRANPYKRSPPDIIFFYKGKTIFCEVKTPDKLGHIKRNWKKLVDKVSPSNKHLHDQVDCCLKIRSHGQIFIFVDSLETLKDELRMIDDAEKSGKFSYP